MAGPSADIEPANAHLVGIWIQLLFTGAYYVYLPQCALILRRKVRDGLSIWLPLVCGLFFALTTISLVVEMVRGYQAFAAPGGLDNRPNPVAYFRDGASPLSLVKNSIVVITVIISDAVLVYRTYIVWNGNYFVVILPSLIFLASTGMGIWATHTLSQTKSGEIQIFAAVTIRVRYFFVLTFCLNLLCVGLICWRIWRIAFRPTDDLSDRSPLSRILSIMIESAGFYCAYLCILIITDCVGTNAFFLFLNPTAPVVAIVYSLLIVRTQTPREYAQSTLPATSTLHFGSSTQRSLQNQSFTPAGVEIHLNRVVESDRRVSTRAMFTSSDSSDIIGDKDKAQVI